MGSDSYPPQGWGGTHTEGTGLLQTPPLVTVTLKFGISAQPFACDGQIFAGSCPFPFPAAFRPSLTVNGVVFSCVPHPPHQTKPAKKQRWTLNHSGLRRGEFCPGRIAEGNRRGCGSTLVTPGGCDPI